MSSEFFLKYKLTVLGANFRLVDPLNVMLSNVYGWQAGPLGDIVSVLFGQPGSPRLGFITSLADTDLRGLVGVIGNKKCSIHRLHAAGAGETPHQPVVNALHMVGVHAR